jgi:hypothetical protein
VLWFLRGGSRAERLRRVAPVAVLAIPFVAYTLIRTTLVPWPVWAGDRLSAYLRWRNDRLVTTASTLADSLQLMVWPHPLRYSYIEYVPHDVPWAILLNAVVLAFAAASWRRWPAITVGVAAFYLGMLPSTVLVQDLMLFPGVFAERYIYLPSAALTIPLAFGLAALATSRGYHAVGAIGMAGYLVFAPLTLLRNEAWHGSLQLFEADYFADRSNGQNAAFLCRTYLDQQRLGDATALCDQFFREYPASDPMAEACAIAYRRARRPDDELAALRRAAEVTRSPRTLTLLARLELERGDRVAAEASYELAVERSGTPVTRHIRRGESIMALHPERAAEARKEFEAALALEPSSATARDWIRRTDAALQRNAEGGGRPSP